MTDQAAEPVDPPLPEGAVVDNAPVGTPVDAPAPSVAIVEFIGGKPFGREFTGARRITKKQFKTVHIDAPADLEWTELNGWKQEIGLEHEALLDFFRKDKTFKVHEG